MTNPTISFLAMILFVLTGCEKHSERSPVEKSLMGTWQWISTDGGLASHIHDTPQSTGKNIDVKISSDGNYSIFTNGALTSSGTYKLDSRKCIHDKTNKTFINFSSDTDFMIESIDKDHLELSDEAYDGVGSRFKRKHN